MRVSNVKIEDRLLLEKACSEGCRVSLDQIHRRYRSSILDYLKKKAPDRNTAEDILQEVFRQVMEGKCGYDGLGSPQNYLIGVAGKLLKKELSRENTSCSVGLPDDFADLFADNTCRSPSEILEAIELAQDLQVCISKLSVKLRKAVESIYMEGKTCTEAAEESGCSYNTFRKRVEYALEELKSEKFLQM